MPRPAEAGLVVRQGPRFPRRGRGAEKSGLLRPLCPQRRKWSMGVFGGRFGACCPRARPGYTIARPDRNAFPARRPARPGPGRTGIRAPPPGPDGGIPASARRRAVKGPAGARPYPQPMGPGPGVEFPCAFRCPRGCRSFRQRRVVPCLRSRPGDGAESLPPGRPRTGPGRGH